MNDLNSNSSTQSAMNDQLSDPTKPLAMSDKIFYRFSTFIHDELGIKMPEAKKTMLQARLQKRLRNLGISSFKEYYDYVFSSRGLEDELANMIDVVTTNKTDFFREPDHFDFLVQKILPRIIRKKQSASVQFPCISGLENPLSVPAKAFTFWSAACSTGEEPYTLAMVLNDFAVRSPSFTYTILGTDISTEVLKKARLGIYDYERVKPVPMMLRKRYLLKSKDESKKLVRIVPELRAAVTFKRLNLMESSFSVQNAIDIIFLRNVLIYFDRPTQESVLTRLCEHLDPDGYLFVGHSETLSGLNVPLIPVASTVYRRGE